MSIRKKTLRFMITGALLAGAGCGGAEPADETTPETNVHGPDTEPHTNVHEPGEDPHVNEPTSNPAPGADEADDADPESNELLESDDSVYE